MADVTIKQLLADIALEFGVLHFIFSSVERGLR